PAPGAQPTFEPDRIRVAQGSDDGRGSRLRKFAIAVVLLGLIGGGGWYAWNSGAISSLQEKLTATKEGEQVPTVSAPVAGGAPAAPATSVPPAELDASAR
ncbi:hypothetical protein MXD81_17660, partial [Microbacteriaceae bacterium K1510]|nr:hypothetical protein [Microbacteriaceae bacterium K1510]